MLIHADKYSPAFSVAAYQKILNGEIADKDMWKYSSFWYKNFDDMAKKTLLRQLISRWGIMSIEMQKGYVGDSNFIQVENGEFVNVPGEEVDGQQSMPAQEEPPASPAPAEAVNLADL